MSGAPTQMIDDHHHSQAELDVDPAFEMQEFESNELVGDGMIYTDTWLLPTVSLRNTKKLWYVSTPFS